MFGIRRVAVHIAEDDVDEFAAGSWQANPTAQHRLNPLPPNKFQTAGLHDRPAFYLTTNNNGNE
jgi:hypothetical protein